MLCRTDTTLSLWYWLLVWVVSLWCCILIPLHSARCRYDCRLLLRSQRWDRLWNLFYRILLSKTTSSGCQRLFALRINDPLLWILMDVARWKVPRMHQWCSRCTNHWGLLFGRRDYLWAFYEHSSVLISSTGVHKCRRDCHYFCLQGLSFGQVLSIRDYSKTRPVLHRS